MGATGAKASPERQGALDPAISGDSTIAVARPRRRRAPAGPPADAKSSAKSVPDSSVPAAEISRKAPRSATQRHSGERSEDTLNALDDAVARTDSQGRIEYLNPAAAALLGCGDEALGRPISQHLKLVDEATREPCPDPVRRVLEERHPVQTAEHATLISADRRDVAVVGSVTPLFDGAGEISGTVVVLRDVEQTRALEREMSFLARHDPLTGLINRRELERRLRELIESGRPTRREHAFLYLDLDQFKLVNDTCGHLAGDEMLKQVAEVLQARMRRSDVLARLGGDEFGFLLYDCDAEAAMEIADVIRRMLRAFRFEWEGQPFEIGASIGMVPINKASGDFTELLRAADAACYVVKDAGGNGVHAFSADDTAITVRQGEMLWVQRLQRALAEGRLRLHYQLIEPIRDRSARPLCELFVRFVDRDGATHRANSFVGAAERFGLMGEIDRWVIRKAFLAIAEADGNRRRLPVASTHAAVDGFTINLSARSLSDGGLLDFVVEELERSAVDPERVCFEITETAAISHLGHAMRLISALKQFGCRFVLDDFGRGLSSFAYLRDLKVDLLKIDGEFVSALANDTIHRAMVAAIHQVGRVMGLSTIAEGVEDQATLDTLREIGLDYAQGYHLHRPEVLIHDH
jgi:diguanylate cyclase (GGDEF)-like protein/PAS domain S-box-containing protein